MNELTDQYGRLVNGLGLQPAEDELFIGKLRGFPIALKFIRGESSALLLFQIRHPLPAEARGLSDLCYGDELDRLITEKKVEISMEDRLAWLTLVDGAGHLADGSVLRLLNAVLTAFEKAGLGRNPELCHYCQTEHVATLTCENGRVAQICPACLRQRTQPIVAGAGALPMLALCPVAALVGAVGWAAIWIAYDLLFELRKTNVLHIPRIVAAVVMVIVGGLVGGPVGWVMKRIPQKGKQLYAMVPALLAIFAVVAGEVLYVTWLVYREMHVIWLGLSLKLLTRLWIGSDGFFLIMKLLAAGAGVFTAVTIARPAKPKTKL
jgi:hypothetical protein